MITEVFSVFDKAVNAFLPPFQCRTKGEAIRSFSEAVNDPSKSFGKYSVDYVLMGLGTWDDNSGLFSPRDPIRIIGASEVIDTPPEAETPR
ncbi:nonstructural protein [Blackfly microvirus SF02]|uniref:Nonstructural protein n=1 Tax=Blackfly microvirus SF02 TaxID=2576452 RepID=A0A4V1F5E5_9VIRU|nr:nonstructural protein [Blackfly microvirus SF02]